MGQQQLLLIVLGVIIVGIAVVVGINLFNANAEESAKDTVVSGATNIGAMAQQYYKKPKSMGGGGNTFVGFSIPSKLATDSSAAVKYTASSASATGITITSDPFDYAWSTTTLVTDSSITTTITGD